jgi:hypothetical protein
MTTTLKQVADAIKVRLEALDPSINVTSFIPAFPQFPCAFLTPPEDDTEDLAMETDVMTSDLVFMVSKNDPEQQQALWDYIDKTSPLSVRQMFQGDRGVGFTDVDVKPGAWTWLGLQELGGQSGFTSALSLMISLG